MVGGQIRHYISAQLHTAASLALRTPQMQQRFLKKLAHELTVLFDQTQKPDVIPTTRYPRYLNMNQVKSTCLPSL